MGGKALKNCETRRYTTEELQGVTDLIVPKLREVLKCRVDAIRYYSLKEDHGDLDIIVECMPGMRDTLLEKIREHFPWVDIHYNNTVVSVNFNDLQVDYIFVPPSHYHMMSVLLAYNDLGGFMGIIAKRWGMKYGSHGLDYLLYSEDRTELLETIHLSHEPASIFSFLGFDFERFCGGFKSPADIFIFVVLNKFFNKSYFLDNVFTGKHGRNTIRPMYQSLVSFIETLPESKDIALTQGEIDKRVYNFFGVDIARKREEKREKQAQHKLAKAKFNGKLVREKYGEIEGPTLGRLINEFRKMITLDGILDFNALILETPEVELWKLFEQIRNRTK